MAEIAPFRGTRYDPSAVDDLSLVVAPPYDVITEADREALEAASPYNVVRLILGRDEPGDDERSNKYTRARGLLEAWRAAGVLREDAGEALYVYEQRYRIGDEKRFQRGVLGAVRLDEPEAGGVLPHERTYEKIVQDRLQLLRATETNLDTIFCIYDGQEQGAHDAIERTASTPPVAQFTTEDDVEHVLWSMTDVLDIGAVGRALEKAPVVIADGHHRWQTWAINCWDAQRLSATRGRRTRPVGPSADVPRGCVSVGAIAAPDPSRRRRHRRDGRARSDGSGSSR